MNRRAPCCTAAAAPGSAQRRGGESGQAFQAGADPGGLQPDPGQHGQGKKDDGQRILQVQPGDAGQEQAGREIALFIPGEKIGEDDQGGAGQFREKVHGLEYERERDQEKNEEAALLFFARLAAQRPGKAPGRKKN